MGGLRLVLLLVLLTISNTAAASLKLAAASNLNQVLSKLILEFNKSNPQIDISITYGASGTLSQQIALGAPYDIFLSASPEYVDRLAKLGLIANRRVFAYGRLALYYSRRINLTPENIYGLLQKSVDRIVIANPKHAPYGRAAVECLIFYNIYDITKNKLIYAANVSQAAQMAIHGADAALIALPLVYNLNMKNFGGYLELPINCHTPLLHEVVIINPSHPANEFFNFLISKEAAVILSSYGYEVP